MPPRGVLLAVLAVALGAALIAVGLWLRAGGAVPLAPQGYRVSVALPDGTGLARGAGVRISGVDVGRVTEVDRGRTGTVAELEIEPRFAPLPRDARVLLRTASLLGERFVAISPGTAGGPTVPDGGRIAAGGAATPTVGDLLDALDPPTRRSVERLTATVRWALRGNGDDLNALLGRTPDAAERLDRLTAVVDGQRPVVERLVRRGERTLGALADGGEDLEAIVGDARGLAADGARRADALTRTIDGLPELIAQVRATAREGAALARRGGSTVRALRDGADRLPAAVAAAEELLPPAAALLDDARPLARRAARTLPAAEAAVAQLPALAAEARDVTRRMPSFFAMLDAYRGQLVTWVAKLAAVTQASVQVAPGRTQHAIRLAAVVGNSPLFGTDRRQPSFRGNPYPAPGAMGAVSSGGPLAAWDCRHAGDPPSYAAFGGSPPCRQQRPWTFDGATRSFPHVAPLADDPPRAVRGR